MDPKSTHASSHSALPVVEVEATVPVKSGDVESTVTERKPSNVEVVVESNQPTTQPSVEDVDASSPKSEGKRKGNRDSNSTDNGKNTDNSSPDVPSNGDNSSPDKPSSAVPVVPTNSATPVPIAPAVTTPNVGGAGNILNFDTTRPTPLPTDLTLPAGPSLDAVSDKPALNKQATLALIVCGVVLLFSAFAFFLIRKSRRARSKADFNEKIDWEEAHSGPSDDLEMGGSTHRTSHIPTGPHVDWSTLRGTVDPHRWELIRGSEIQENDRNSIASTISTDSTELSYIPEAIQPIEIAVPTQFRAPSTRSSLVRPHNLFDNEQLLPVDPSVFSPDQEGFSKEWEDETTRRW